MAQRISLWQMISITSIFGTKSEFQLELGLPINTIAYLAEMAGNETASHETVIQPFGHFGLTLQTQLMAVDGGGPCRGRGTRDGNVRHNKILDLGTPLAGLKAFIIPDHYCCVTVLQRAVQSAPTLFCSLFHLGAMLRVVQGARYRCCRLHMAYSHGAFLPEVSRRAQETYDVCAAPKGHALQNAAKIMIRHVGIGAVLGERTFCEETAHPVGDVKGGSGLKFCT
ncbi:hypothetical protein GGX14DRAFT_395791 [Mycena pura]|uniref:Uncharacterized protein n=1 Tax=Mycena pura TaxID=153505 RepID=A0AAD6VE61_9AGAR|nr:hypothetical protein GGX14DRAFT_395791 [Mycena pura]